MAPELAGEYGEHPAMIYQWFEPLSAIGPRVMARLAARRSS
ncbi:hypothetical protein QWZ10_21150 [Paracoccus cavernae]|uniref:Uncharacterized protein n=1 Tax=Paracoccus cavernae TaxID=1571207 RepID=A0ABT8DAB0_9RHOB|nr:hypothetical protein [Paracoccus cavernae]